MAVTTSSNARSSTEVLISKKWNHRETTSSSSSPPERNIIWIEPKLNKALKSVPVIYYISRNGQLEHPHFIEVPLSSSHDGLYLRDVINRLNFLRGKGMGYLFSWSCKRSYKNGYVWHDLSENDLIHPTNGQDYVLKGSELLENSISSRFCEISLPESQKSPSDSDENRVSSSSSSTTARRRRRNQSWSSFENPQQEYRLVYKCESGREIAGKFTSTAAAADAATQTEENRKKEKKIAELSVEDLSPPPASMSSSDGMDGGDGSKGARVGDQTAENEFSSGRMSASRVVMQLITCGSSTSADFSKNKDSEVLNDNDAPNVTNKRSRFFNLAENNLLSRAGEEPSDLNARTIDTRRSLCLHNYLLARVWKDFAREKNVISMGDNSSKGKEPINPIDDTINKVNGDEYIDVASRIQASDKEDVMSHDFCIGKSRRSTTRVIQPKMLESYFCKARVSNEIGVEV